MPKRNQHDHYPKSSPGDARKPMSDEGGPDGRHAQTHDVRREQFTNPKGPQPVDESFAEQIAPHSTKDQLHSHAEEMTQAVDDKALHEQLPQLDSADLTTLPVLQPGTRLEQGSVYLDLDDLARGPFKAIGGQEAGQRYVAKREVEYEMWNRLVGDEREAEVERPAGVD